MDSSRGLDLLPEGAVALVTGASRGIGEALVAELEARQVRVIGCSRASGQDLRHEADVEALFATIEARFGHLDLLVNNAGILTPRRPMHEITTGEWDDSMAINLRGVFLCCRAALRLMLPRGRGVILNISSGAGKRPAPHWGPYGVAKWGVEGFTRSVAEETHDTGIRVVAVNPGATRTGMRASAYPDEDSSTVKTPAAFARDLVNLLVAGLPGGVSIDHPFTQPAR